jgi:hypothetical protein
MRLRLAVSSCVLFAFVSGLSAQEMVRMQPPPPAREKAAETPEAKKLKEENTQRAKELLQRAYGSTKTLSDSDRAAVIARLASSSQHEMPEQSKAWGDEVFQITSGLSNDNFRGQYEMTALLAVAENDPDHALQLLTQMSPPGTNENGTSAMDLRSPAASSLFQKYFQKKGEEGLPALQSTARQLGELGLYPFMAIGPVIRQVGRKDQDKARGMATEALGYFPRLQQNDMSLQQMAMFLRMNREFIATPVLKDVLSQLVNKALDSKNTSNSTLITSINTNGNSATLKGASNLMLYQLMPMIKDVDPEWAKKLEDQNEQLRGAAIAQQNSPSGTNTVRMGVFMGGGGNGNNLNAAALMDPMKVAEVDELAQKDPLQALKMTDQINDPATRAATSVRLAGDINGSDPEKAAQLVKNAKDAIALTPEPSDKLRILAGLAQAQGSMTDTNGLSTTLKQGFALGEDLYRKSVDKNPSLPITMRPGVDSLGRLITAGMKADQQQAMENIDKLSMPALQTMMLISAAESLDPEMKGSDTGMRIVIRN